MTNTSTDELPGAPLCSLPVDNESRGWSEISFVDGSDAWAPAAVKGKNGDGKFAAESALGVFYAAELIGHLLQHGGEGAGVGERLKEVAEAIAMCGRFGATESAFFTALGEFIALRRFPISGDFDAVPYAAQSEQPG